MGYIEVTLGGKPMGLKFNMAANDELVRRVHKHNGKLSEAQMAYIVIFSGLLGNYVAKDIDMDFTFEQVTEWVDDLYVKNEQDILVKVLEVYTTTQQYKKLFEKPVESTGKKKALKTKSLKTTNLQ